MPRMFPFKSANSGLFRLLLPLVLLVFTACEKVLDIDLKDAPPRVIIEANLSDQPSPHQVLVSRSVGFNDPNQFPQVSGARVILSDNAGLADTLTEVAPGRYETRQFQGQPGRTYTLKVTINGEEYLAVSTMPQPVPIMNIAVESFRFDPERKSVKFEFQEPGGVKNYYRALYTVNDTLSTQLNIFSDEFNDGKFVDETLIDRDLELDPGDRVNVKLQTIDENVYRFLREQDQLGNSQAASPANPRSMFSNGALGYFSAHAETEASLVVP